MGTPPLDGPSPIARGEQAGGVRPAVLTWQGFTCVALGSPAVSGNGTQIIEATAAHPASTHLPYEVGFEDMARRVPDVTKIASLTGWEAKRSLEDILADVVDEVRAEAGA